MLDFRLWKVFSSDRGGERRLRAAMLQHHEFIWRNLRRMGVPHTDVDDAAQEVFWVFARRMSRVAPALERAFLLGTALRVACNYRRKKRSLPLEAADELRDAGFNPEELRELLLARRRLDEILDAMDDEQRAVFVLCELEELSVPAIAELLDLPVGTVASRLRAARQWFDAAVQRLQARAIYGRSSA